MSIRGFLRLSAHIQLMPVLESGEETLVGGQAVIEGVMMRAPHSYCVAVRKPGGGIVTQEMAVPRMSEKYPAFKLPVLRGLGTIGQAMSLGFKALKFSADVAIEEENAKGSEAKAQPSKAKETSSWALALNLIFSLGFFIFLYKLVPLYLVSSLEKVYPVIHNRILFNGLDGVIRIVIFLGFLALISRWKDVHRVFEYHGAEHKVVFNYESGQAVNVANAQAFTTYHPRCGTSFLMVVMVISMLVYMLIPADTFAVKMAVRIAMLPVIAGLSYEMIRFAAKRRGSFMALLTTPGLWLQRITTQPPSDDQAEIAIHALNRAMALESEQGGELVIA